MTVSQLIKELNEIDNPDAVVIIHSEESGEWYYANEAVSYQAGSWLDEYGDSVVIAAY